MKHKGMINWLVCLIIGHKWVRFGYPTRDGENLEKDDIQLYRCHRCWAMPQVPHNGELPRWVLPIHWTKKKEVRRDP